jgi:3-oxoacyl-[acyl-carrier protein] reductase
MDLGLTDRVALVTGASKGIGRGIAEALAAEGARVAVAARSADGVRAAAAAVGGRGYVFDSSDLDAVGPLVDAVQAELGPIDVYVANTGGPPLDPDPLSFGVEQWEAAHRTLVISPMLVLQRVLPGMRSRGWGRVLAVSSSAAVEPLPSLQLSNVNRPGLLSAFKHLARETAGDGVTFNAVLPGRIWTDRLQGNYGDIESAGSGVPAGRAGTVAEIAAAAAFLCSAPASYITGQSLLVDGGFTRAW